MANGDIYVRRNSSLTDVLPNAGTNLDANWDAVKIDVGGIVSYSSPNFTLDAGMYLVMYSEKFSTNDVTNNERIEIQGEIHVPSQSFVGGYSQDFIRKSSGQQDCNLTGSTLIQITSNATDLFVRFYRTDNSTSGLVTRVPNFGSVMIVQLDNADSYGLYTTSASHDLTITETVIPINTLQRQNTGFTRVGNTIEVSDAGRYFATYSADFSMAATGREDVVGRLMNNGVEITGTSSYAYLRGADGCQDGAITWMGVLDLAANSVIELRGSVPTSASVTIPAGAAYLQFWKLPTTNRVCIKEATTGDYNAPGPFTWDTLEYIDSDTFTATGPTTSIQSQEADYLLSFATFHQDAPDTVQRGYPEVRFTVDGVKSTTSSAGSYHRNSGGSGIVAVNLGDLIAVDNNSDVVVNIEPTGASGAMNNDSGQFSTLSLSKTFSRTYLFPPKITAVGDGQLDVNEANVLVTGIRFGSVQGTGKVYISPTPNFDAGTAVEQTVNSWSDTQINIDTNSGSIPDGLVYAILIRDDNQASEGFGFGYGLTPYVTVIANTNPDHWWSFDNTYDDLIQVNSFTVTPSGTNGFSATPICEETSFSWRSQFGRRECANSADINTGTKTDRTMGGWIMLGDVSPKFSCIYEEGGGVNNLAYFTAVGNVLIAQLADSGDDNVQVYSDFQLEPQRAYHVMFRFSYTDGTNEFKLFIDGIQQQNSQGNPLLATDLDAHSGDISIGGPGGTLEVGGTDVSFPSGQDTYFSNWVTYSTPTDEADIVRLFKRGAIPTYTINSDTEANMQLQLDALANTAIPNTPLAIRVLGATDTENLNLTADNITVTDTTSIDLEWRGVGTLNWKNINGSNIKASKTFSESGNPINIINPAVLTLVGLEPDTEVRVYQAGTADEQAGVENSATTFSATIEVPSVDIVLMSIDYIYQKLENIDTSTDTTLPVQQFFDRNYKNP